MSAKPATPAPDDHAAPKKGPGLVAWALVSLVSGGAGFIVPMMLTGKQAGDHHKEEKKPEAAVKPAEKLAIIPFDSTGVTVNLNEVQPHFLRFTMSLQIDATQEKVVSELLTEKKLLLRNWLLIHISDKQMDDVRGAAGKNMLAREILERFNSLLFTDGYDRIYQVLFEEFTIQ